MDHRTFRTQLLRSPSALYSSPGTRRDLAVAEKELRGIRVKAEVGTENADTDEEGRGQSKCSLPGGDVDALFVQAMIYGVDNAVCRHCLSTCPEPFVYIY